MTARQIRQAYMDCIRPRISEAVRHAGDRQFDMLFRVLNGPEGYTLFHPMTPCFKSGDGGVEFDALCELYGHIRYCWDDDGEMSFVHATTTSPYVMNPAEESVATTAFVMRGEYDSQYLVRGVERAALRHAVEHSRLASYTACRFNPDTLEWMHGLIPEWERIREMGRKADAARSMKRVHEYFGLGKWLLDVYLGHIMASEYHHGPVSCKGLTSEKTRDSVDVDE